MLHLMSNLNRCYDRCAQHTVYCGVLLCVEQCDLVGFVSAVTS